MERASTRSLDRTWEFVELVVFLALGLAAMPVS